MTIDKSTLAKLFSVAVPTIDGWIRRGCPVARRPKSGKVGSGYQFDSAAVIRWYCDREIAAALKKGGAGTIRTTEQIRREREETMLAERKLNLEAKQRKLVLVEDVQADAFRTAKTMRDGLLNIPDRLAPILAAETDADKIHASLTQEIRQTLTVLADKLEGRNTA